MPGGCIDANGTLQGAGRGAGAVRTVRWRTATRAALRKWHICGFSFVVQINIFYTFFFCATSQL